MATFIPSGGSLPWNLTSSWKTSSAAAPYGAPSGFGTASALPGVDDEVWMNSTLNMYLDLSLTPYINIKRWSWLATGSITGNASGQVLIHSTNNSISSSFKILVENGITASTSTINQSPIIISSQPASNQGIDFKPIEITASISAGVAGGSNGPGVILISSNPSTAGQHGLILNIKGDLRQSGSGAYPIIWQAARNVTINIDGDISSSVGNTGGAGAIYFAPQSINGILNVNGIFSTSSTLPVIDISGSNHIINVTRRIETRSSASAVRIQSGGSNVRSYVQLGTPTTPITAISSGSGQLVLVSAGNTLSTSIADFSNTVFYYGDYSSNSTKTNIVSPRTYISSNNITIATASGTTTITIPTTDTTDPTPATSDVYSGVIYGLNNGKTGVLTTPSSSNVRSTTTYSSGSIGSTPSLITGTAAIPPQNDVRFGISYDTAPSGGRMIVPIASQVSSSFKFDNTTGCYSGSKDFWATPHSTMTTGIGQLVSQSLNTRAGTITGSMIGLLDTDSSNVVTRLRSIATVADVGNALTQSANI